MVKIKINYSKCQDASGCKICLQKCPNGVLMTYPGKTSKDYGMTPKSIPKTRHVYAIFLNFCDLCMKCVNICPKSAINIKR